MTKKQSQLISTLKSFAKDVNPKEIGSQIAEDNLDAWCCIWREAIKDTVKKLEMTMLEKD